MRDPMIQRRLSGSLSAIALVATAMMLTGCRTDAQTGALIGTGIGASLGAIIGHQSGHGGEGALIGAGIGALGGYAVGNEGDKQHGHWGRCNYDY